MDAAGRGRRLRTAWPVAVGVAVVTVIGAVNMVIPPALALFGAFAVGPCLAGVAASATTVAIVGGYALLFAAAVSWTNGIWGTWEQAFYLTVIAGITVISMAVAHRIRKLRDLAEQGHADRDTLAAVVESSDDAILVHGLDGAVRAWNPGAERMYGYPREEASGRNVSMILPAEEAAELPRQLERIAHGDHIDPFEARRIAKDGTVVDVSVSMTSIRDHRGAVVAAASIARDITGRKRAEALARQIQQRSVQNERLESLGQLAGGIAHDFNNVLAIVLNYAEFLTEAVDGDPEAAADLDRIKVAAGRARDLVRHLLVFARREPARTEDLDLAAVISTTRDLLTRTINENIELVGKTPEQPLPIRADRGQIEQVLLNLVLNARDAMPGGGTIVVEAGAVDVGLDRGDLPPSLVPGRYARLVVCDTGEGMTGEVVARVFEPFFTTKPKDKGVGLGLATAYGTVSQAGGTITIHSEPGVGTTVAVYLPLTEEPVSETATAGPAVEHASRGQGQHVLVVEDEDAVRAVIVRILERHGYATLAADRGSLALDLARHHPPDLLLTDVIMPEMSGQQVAERLRHHRPHLPVVFVTGYSDGLLDPQRLTEAGTLLIQKPFTTDELLSAVHRALHPATLRG